MPTKKTRQAIEAPRRSIFMIDPHALVLIGLDTKDGPSHPRYDVRVFNKFRENIVRGMLKYGIKKPISVMKVGERLEVVDGRQRVINAREANRRLKEAGEPVLRVPVLPPEQGTDAKMSGLMVLLNTHSISMSPYSLGQMAQTLYDRGYADEEVALHLDVTVPTVKNYVSLLSLKPEIQEMIIKDKIPASKGYELARKDEKGQKAFLTRLEKGSRSGPPKRAPSKQALRKLVDENKLPSLFLMGLKFALGDITGLGDLNFSSAATDPLPEAKASKTSEAAPAPKRKLSVVKPAAETKGFRVEKRVIAVNGKDTTLDVKVFDPGEEPAGDPEIHVTSYGKPGEA
jgi:ParB family chromosome partitioning protein